MTLPQTFMDLQMSVQELTSGRISFGLQWFYAYDSYDAWTLAMISGSKDIEGQTRFPDDRVIIFQHQAARLRVQ